jgi:hypothetical protein
MIWIVLMSVGIGYIVAQIENCIRELRAISRN